jgi:hypothetical protein
MLSGFLSIFSRNIKYDETTVSQGEYPETSNSCFGLATLKALKHPHDPDFNPFTNAEDRAAAGKLQKDSQVASHNQTQEQAAAELLLNDGMQIEIPNRKTNSLASRERFLHNIQVSTEDDGKTRVAIIVHNGIDKTAKQRPIRHAVFFGTSLNSEKVIQCAAMDSNFFVAKGSGEAGCQRVIERLSDCTRQYPSRDKTSHSMVAARCQ